MTIGPQKSVQVSPAIFGEVNHAHDFQRTAVSSILLLRSTQLSIQETQINNFFRTSIILGFRHNLFKIISIKKHSSDQAIPSYSYLFSISF
jgi:hypothetical protein